MITFDSLISLSLLLSSFSPTQKNIEIQCKNINPTTAFFFPNIHATRKDADVALSCSVQAPYRVRCPFEHLSQWECGVKTSMASLKISSQVIFFTQDRHSLHSKHTTSIDRCKQIKLLLCHLYPSASHPSFSTMN